MEGDRGAEGVDEAARCRGVVEILHDDRKPRYRQRDRIAQQHHQAQRQQQRKDQRQLVPRDLGEFLAHLRENSAHYSSFATLPCLRAFSTTTMKTSSREYGSSYESLTSMPAAFSFEMVSFLPVSASSSVITCSRSPKSDTRHRSSFSRSRSAAFCGWSTMNSSKCPPCLLFTSRGVPSATSSPATMKPRRLHCSASSR